jgi:hypothetical protein
MGTLPMAVIGNNSCATNDCDLLAGGTEVWEAFTIDDTMNVAVTYCGTTPAFEVVYSVLVKDCPCSGELVYATWTGWEFCLDGNAYIHYDNLAPGTYYIPILSSHADYPAAYFSGPYTVNVIDWPQIPWYCPAKGGCDEYISRVTVAELDHSSVCDEYSYYYDQTAHMFFGAEYPITIEISDGWTQDYGAVWIDWNQDHNFTGPNEEIPLVVFSGLGPYTGTITPPPDAKPGLTCMRVRLRFAQPPEPCGPSTYGEVEDYNVYVAGSPPPDIQPDPMKALYAFAVNQFVGTAFVNNSAMSGGYTLSDIDLPTLGINSNFEPNGILEPELEESVLKFYFDVSVFVNSYGLIWDTVINPYTITGEFDDGVPFSLDYNVKFIGHASGDANLDGAINVGDAVFLINYVFKDGMEPGVFETADANCDGDINVADAVRLVNYIFRGGEKPCHIQE